MNPKIKSVFALALLTIVLSLAVSIFAFAMDIDVVLQWYIQIGIVIYAVMMIFLILTIQHPYGTSPTEKELALEWLLISEIPENLHTRINVELLSTFNYPRSIIVTEVTTWPPIKDTKYTHWRYI